MNSETDQSKTERILTLREARALCKPLGRLEPYRGYGYDLGNGRFLAHRPDGKLVLSEPRPAAPARPWYSPRQNGGAL